MSTKITSTSWGQHEGQPIQLFTITNDAGMIIQITNFGGIVTSWKTPDRNGTIADIVMGFDNLEAYLGDHPFFGAIIGRYGNRIAKGKFTIGDTSYSLATNNGPNHLHGGNKGFDKVVWSAAVNDDQLILRYSSTHGEEGYPGNLQVTVSYSLTEKGTLIIDYLAETDAATLVNLTNHSYFNLSGDYHNTILDHVLRIESEEYTPMDATNIPTGVIQSVKDTPFDFIRPKKVGADFHQLENGYDHNFVIKNYDQKLRLAAELFHPESGRKLETFTTEPGMQLYTGNYLDGTLKSPLGTPFIKHGALCLETQHFPDSPNHPHFPSTLLTPDETYHSITQYKVSCE